MELQAGMLRSIVDQMGLPPLGEVGKQAGVSAAFRVIARYHDRRAADSVATLRRIGKGDITLEVAYRGLFKQKPMHFRIETARYEALMTGLTGLHFDHMIDQQDIPTYGVDLWMIERVAGSFVKSVIVTPELAMDDHARLVELVRVTMGEMVREVRA